MPRIGEPDSIGRSAMPSGASKSGTSCGSHQQGDLAALLRLATGSAAVIATPNAAHCGEAQLECADIVGELVLVAGVGFEPTTFRL